MEIVHKWEGNVNDREDDVLLGENESLQHENGKSNYSGSITPLETGDEDEKSNLIGPSFTKDELRAKPLHEIESLLESRLFQVSSQGPAPLTLPIDRNTSFVAFGLDSMTVVQFKGVIENRYQIAFVCAWVSF